MVPLGDHALGGAERIADMIAQAKFAKKYSSQGASFDLAGWAGLAAATVLAAVPAW